jgi:hypothetical protein
MSTTFILQPTLSASQRQDRNIGTRHLKAIFVLHQSRRRDIHQAIVNNMADGTDDEVNPFFNYSIKSTYSNFDYNEEIGRHEQEQAPQVPYIAELERMAASVSVSNSRPPPSQADINRWISLFNYTPEEAYSLITAHRADVTREPISPEHWELVRTDREPEGYDLEAYEHSLSLKSLLDSQTSVVHDKEGNKWCVFRLRGLLASAEKVKEIAGLKEVPKVTKGQNESGEVDFCWVDEEAKGKIDEWMMVRQVSQVKLD